MVLDGKARLVETRPGDASPVCVFETVAGDTFRAVSYTHLTLPTILLV